MLAPWAIVRVPFPYVERPVRYHRPALVLATFRPTAHHALAWVAMITSAENAGWEGDVAIADLVTAGLPHRSVVRTAKLATIDPQEFDLLGELAPESRPAVQRWIGTRLAELLSS